MNPAADYARLAKQLEDEIIQFASFPVNGRLIACDAATFQVDVAAEFPAGIVDVFDVPGFIVARRRDSAPVTWTTDGKLNSSATYGAVLTEAAHQETQGVDANLVDPTYLPFALETPKADTIALFTLRETTSQVATGYDADGRACVLLIYV
jgi:hypothetical protein